VFSCPNQFDTIPPERQIMNKFIKVLNRMDFRLIAIQRMFMAKNESSQVHPCTHSPQMKLWPAV